jgi:c-di-GMP-related signal transduction protein|tara:strand:- start:306 stop:752 length:447 start_codon:yes stop_codon:yes gene_type:complete
MIDLKSIHDMWEKDCVINDMKLDESSRQTPILHAKYLQLLSTVKLQLKRAEFSQKTLLKQKWLWYNGKMDPIAINELGWDPDPFDGLKVLKGDMNLYYDADPEIQKSEEKIQYYKTIIETLTDIISNITWRHQTIKNMIEWKKFSSGN